MSSHKTMTGNKLTAAAREPKSASYDKYMAEDDLRTLARAQEIQRDRERMKAVKTCARDQMKTLAKVTGGSKRK